MASAIPGQTVGKDDSRTGLAQSFQQVKLSLAFQDFANVVLGPMHGEFGSCQWTFVTTVYTIRIEIDLIRVEMG